MQHSVTTGMSVGVKAKFSMVVINIKSDMTGEFSSFHRHVPRAKHLANHMITIARLLVLGAIVVSVNSTPEKSAGLVPYN